MKTKNYLVCLCTLFLTCMLAGLALPVSLSAHAVKAKSQAATKSASTKPKKGSGAADSNIKKQQVKNDPSMAGKTAPRGRGAGPYACVVHVDNRTLLYSKVYIDGDYVGMVGPAGDVYVRTGNGTTTAYVRADFDDGSYNYWGPVSFDCEGSFTWRIWP